MKQCARCKITKDLSDYNKSVKQKDGLQPYCRACQKEWMGNGDYMLQRNYNITLEDKRKMIADQNGCCYTCKKPFTSTTSTHVDHCHDSNKIRGILCHNCNTTLGLVGESTQILQNLKDYLEKHAQENSTPPVPAGDYREGEISSEHGTISTAGTREDYYDLDHYQRTVQGENSDYRTQTRGGDSVGFGSSQVGTPAPTEGEQDNWQLHPTYGWLEY